MRYCLYLIVHIVIVLLRYPLAPIAVVLFSSQDRRSLLALRWLMTIDNDLAGDSGWREEHLIGPDPLSTLNRIRWLWRNGGNAVAYGLLGCDAPVKIIRRGIYYWSDGFGHWLYRRKFHLAGRRWLELFFGWALLGPQQGRCKLVCSIRLITGK